MRVWEGALIHLAPPRRPCVLSNANKSRSDNIFVVQHGSVKAVREVKVGEGGARRNLALTILGPGDFFGVLSALGKRRDTTYISVGRSSVLSLTKQNLFKRLHSQTVEDLISLCTARSTLHDEIHNRHLKLSALALKKRAEWVFAFSV